MLNDPRYQKHYQLKHFGEKGQEKLAKAKVLIVGAGGLGTPAAQYLNGIGLGSLGLVDQDTIHISNLPRQTLYTPEDIGRSKVETLIGQLQRQNPQTKFVAHQAFLTPENALDIISLYDLVIDASDNFGTRYLVNDTCVILGKPFIYGAVHEFEGQVSVFNYKNGPTYRCLFPETDHLKSIPNCDQNGVLGVVPGLIGTYQAIEAVKVITQTGVPLSGKLLVIDVLAQTHLQMKFPLLPQNLNIAELKTSYDQHLLPDCTVPGLTIAVLLKWIKEKKDMRIIDVRNPEAFLQNRLVTSENIPLEEIKGNQNKANAQVPIVLVCQSGKRSALAARQLLEENPNLEVYNLLGGLNSLSLI